MNVMFDNFGPVIGSAIIGLVVLAPFIWLHERSVRAEAGRSPPRTYAVNGVFVQMIKLLAIALAALVLAWVIFPGLEVFNKGLAVLTLADLVRLTIAALLATFAALLAYGALEGRS